MKGSLLTSIIQLPTRILQELMAMSWDMLAFYTISSTSQICEAKIMVTRA
jgi:hypothetical protein